MMLTNSSQILVKKNCAHPDNKICINKILPLGWVQNISDLFHCIFFAGGAVGIFVGISFWSLYVDTFGI